MSRRRMINFPKESLLKIFATIGSRNTIASMLNISIKTVASWFTREKLPNETLGLLLFLSEKIVKLEEVESIEENSSEIHSNNRYVFDYLICFKNKKRIKLEIKTFSNKNKPLFRENLALIVDYFVFIEVNSDNFYITHKLSETKSEKYKTLISSFSDRELINELISRGYYFNKLI